METKYFKIVYSSSIALFYYDKTTDSLRGFIEEMKTGNKFAIYKHGDPVCYARASNNTTVQAMLNKAVEISKAEYDAGLLVANSMMESDYWLIADDVPVRKKEETTNKEVVTETVYV